jgi:hypothetical protein
MFHIAMLEYIYLQYSTSLDGCEKVVISIPYHKMFVVLIRSDILILG